MSPSTTDARASDSCPPGRGKPEPLHGQGFHIERGPRFTALQANLTQLVECFGGRGGSLLGAHVKKARKMAGLAAPPSLGRKRPESSSAENRIAAMHKLGTPPEPCKPFLALQLPAREVCPSGYGSQREPLFRADFRQDSVKALPHRSAMRRMFLMPPPAFLSSFLPAQAAAQLAASPPLQPGPPLPLGDRRGRARHPNPGASSGGDRTRRERTPGPAKRAHGTRGRGPSTPRARASSTI